MKMLIFLDTNIVLDFIENRTGFSDTAERILSLAEREDVTLCASVLTFCNIAYILRKLAVENIKSIFDNLSQLMEVVPIDHQVLEKTIKSDFIDFEDGIQYFSAEQAGVSYIITRNSRDFSSPEVKIKVMDPKDFLNAGIIK